MVSIQRSLYMGIRIPAERGILTSLCLRSALRTILEMEIWRLVLTKSSQVIHNKMTNSLLSNTGVFQNVLTNICVHLEDTVGSRGFSGRI